MPNDRGMRRLLVSALVVASAVSAVPADAANRSSVTVVTSVAGQALPRATMESAWRETPRGSELRTTGHTLPGAATTVTAEWVGRLTVARDGRLVTVTESAKWAGAENVGSHAVAVDYYWGGRWRAAPASMRTVGRAAVLVAPINRNVFYADVHQARGLARKTVQVRVRAVLTFDQAAVNVEDLLVVENPR